MHHLTGFQRDILYTVAGLGDPNGNDIKRSLDDYYEIEVFHGRLYPNLDQLVELGLLEKGKKNERDNEYTISDAGLAVVNARRKWENGKIEF